MTAEPRGRPAIAVPIVAVLIDAVWIVVFAVLGRRSHDGGSGPAALVRVATPFVIANVVGWLVLLGVPAVRRRFATDLPQLTLGFGVAIGAVTAAGGLLLRRLAWGDGSAAAFVVVAVVFLVGGLMAWRGFVRHAGR